MSKITTTAIASIRSEVQLQEWKTQVESCISSGLTVREWCKCNNIKVKNYYYHLRRVRELCCEAEVNKIVPLNIPDQSVSENIQITGINISVSLPANVDSEIITVVLREMKTC